MPRTSITYDQDRVTSIIVDGRDINEHVGRPIALSLHNNNQEIAKSVTDTMAIIKDFTEFADIAFSENPTDKRLKEYYESTLNITGMFAWRLGDFSAAETVYQNMLVALRKFESYGHLPLHKGMAFHNIAISQFMQRNFDQSIANFLRAFAEDHREGVTPEQSFALRVLDDHYIKPLVMSIQTSAGPFFQQVMGKALTNEVIDILKMLEPESRFFLLQVWKSLEINQPRDNLYSRCRAFDNAKNLALIAETFLRSCCVSTGDTRISDAYKRKRRPTLRDLLECLFDGGQWFSDLDRMWQSWTQFDKNNIPADVDTKLSDLLEKPLLHSNPHDELIRAILLLGLVRNFTAHEFEPSCDLTGQMHEDVVSRMLAVLLVLFGDLRTASII